MTKSISSSSLVKGSVFFAMLGVLFGGIVLLTSFAHAAAGPVVSVTVRDTTNAVVMTAPIGSVLSASTTVATTTASSTTGTVNFNLFANQTCSGTPTTQSGVSLASSSAVSATTTMGASGLSYTVHYNGDANNVAADSQCVAVVPTSSGVALSTTLSTTSVLAGSSVFDSAVLTGVTNNASGTVSYAVYANNACTVGSQSAGVVAVTNKVVPNSTAVLFTTPGTFYWQAVYSGDTQNAAATSTCGAAVLTVNATGTPPVVVPPPAGTGTVSGVVFNDLNKDFVRTVGEPGISGFSINLHKGTGQSSPVVATATTAADGSYSFPNLAFGSYYVEEINQSGWKQTTSDASRTLSAASATGVVDFANIVKTTVPKTPDTDKDHHFNFGNLFNHGGHEGDDSQGQKGNKKVGKDR